MSTFDATRSGFGYEKPNDGQSSDWWTPPEIVQSLGSFDLDPCAGVGQIPLASRIYVPPQDGLSLPWEGRVFLNQPYGPQVGAWAERLREHGNGIMLIFARTETKAWRPIWCHADAILFPFRRITFLRPGSGPIPSTGVKAKSGTAPSAFVAYGQANVEALRLCGIEGALVTSVEITQNVPHSFRVGT